jgi:hypothetical protein
MRSLNLFFRNIFRYEHKYIFFLTLVPRELFFMTIITNALELAFNHFGFGQFLDLQWSRSRGGSERFREWNKRGFCCLSRENLFFFLNSFSIFHLTLGASVENVCMNLFLESTDKEFSKKNIKHALYIEIQVLKSSYIVFHYT